MDPWSAGNSDLGLGFVHRCFPWFPGGGRWGGMALHSHPGAPATHVPRLLADGVGAGSKRDRHGHRRGGGRGLGEPCRRKQILGRWNEGMGTAVIHFSTTALRGFTPHKMFSSFPNTT